MSQVGRILSPIPRGSGAMVLHRMIESGIPDYRIIPYSPWLTLFPVVLPRLLRSIRCRLIHTTPDHGFFFYRPRTPQVLTIHHYMCDAGIRPYSSVLQQIHYATDLKWFIRCSLKLAKVVTSVSRFSAQQTQNELKLKDPIKVIYNGVDENWFYPDSRKTASPVVRVLFSGNLTRRKGVQWLRPIADGLHQGIVIHYTTGLGRSQVRPRAENICNLGRIPWQNLPDLYRSCHVLLSPTVREGFGLAIAEAMACGLPVVASDCSAVPELVDDGLGGFLCPVGDVQAFVEKINLLAQAPELRCRMGEYNRAKVERFFTVDRMITEYRELFESLL